jgi:hypothetical protein
MTYIEVSNIHEYVEHKNTPCYKFGEWDLVPNNRKLYYISDLDTYIDLNTTTSFLMADEHNIRTIIIDGPNISYLDTNFTNSTTKLSVDDYHRKYCYLDGNLNKWIYTRKYANTSIKNKDVSIFDRLKSMFQ